ncbi:MAG: nuclear transport factor 2 family protein, partial [Betaproteobacteria bacterium]
DDHPDASVSHRGKGTDPVLRKVAGFDGKPTGL